jgi:HAMP domain-containing protein
MAMHLFSTPTQCTNCRTVVDDPTVDRCPNCSELLKERRAPRRLAGVEQRYGNLRILLKFLHFMGVITALVGLLVLAFGVTDDGLPVTTRILIMLGALLGAVVLFAAAAFFDVALDVEENTRSTFRVQQQILEQLQQQERRPAGEVRAP